MSCISMTSIHQYRIIILLSQCLCQLGVFCCNKIDSRFNITTPYFQNFPGGIPSDSFSKSIPLMYAECALHTRKPHSYLQCIHAHKVSYVTCVLPTFLNFYLSLPPSALPLNIYFWISPSNSQIFKLLTYIPCENFYIVATLLFLVKM